MPRHATAPYRPDRSGQIKIVWMTDSHITSGSIPTREANLAAAAADAVTWGADLCIHTGDIGDNFAAGVLKGFNLLRNNVGSVPLVTVPGNHDEHETTPGTPNTATIEGATYFGRSAPLTITEIAVQDDLRVLVVGLDCNYYYGSHLGVENTAHSPGDRIGYSTEEPAGSSYRVITQAQLDFLTAALAANRRADFVLLLVHYPPAGISAVNYAAVADILEADGRAALLLCGHVHPNGTSYTLTSSQGRPFTALKVPALQESGCWCRLTLGFAAARAKVIQAELQNFTDPGGWVINAPFTLAS